MLSFYVIMKVENSKLTNWFLNVLQNIHDVERRKYMYLILSSKYDINMKKMDKYRIIHNNISILVPRYIGY